MTIIKKYVFQREVKILVDYEGNELKIGDKVVYVHGKNSDEGSPHE